MLIKICMRQIRRNSGHIMITRSYENLRILIGSSVYEPVPGHQSNSCEALSETL